MGVGVKSAQNMFQDEIINKKTITSTLSCVLLAWYQFFMFFEEYQVIVIPEFKNMPNHHRTSHQTNFIKEKIHSNSKMVIIIKIQIKSVQLQLPASSPVHIFEWWTSEQLFTNYKSHC